MNMHATQKANEYVEIRHPSGLVTVPSDALMRFTTPMWGFEHLDAFALLPAGRQGLWWFISAGEYPTTFVLADPFVAMEEYGLDLTDGERTELALEDENDALALVLLSMPSAPAQPVTANFKAPLVFNLAERTVKQVVNRDERFSLTQQVELSRYPLRENPSGQG